LGIETFGLNYADPSLDQIGISKRSETRFVNWPHHQRPPSPQTQSQEEEQFALDSVLGVLFGAAANTNTAAMYIIPHIYSNPQLVKDLEKEVVQCFQGNSLDSSSLKNMKLIEACIYEITRKYSIILSFRSVVEPLKYGDYEIPKGRVIAVSSNLSMNGSSYTDPNTFNPYRYMPDHPEYKTNIKHHLGFGNGRHLCKGKALALIELKLIIASFISHFEKVEMTDGVIPEPEWISLGLGYPKDKHMNVQYTRRSSPLVNFSEFSSKPTSLQIIKEQSIASDENFVL